jgi:hypothetical protein
MTTLGAARRTASGARVVSARRNVVSLPGKSRQSILFARRWMPGSSPGMTQVEILQREVKSCGALARHSGACAAQRRDEPGIPRRVVSQQRIDVSRESGFVRLRLTPRNDDVGRGAPHSIRGTRCSARRNVVSLHNPPARHSGACAAQRRDEPGIPRRVVSQQRIVVSRDSGFVRLRLTPRNDDVGLGAPH